VRLEPDDAGRLAAGNAIYRRGHATGHVAFLASEPPESFGGVETGATAELSLVARTEDLAQCSAWVCASKGIGSLRLTRAWRKHSVYVAAAARGSGVGHALMRALIASGREAGGSGRCQSGIFPF